MNIVIYSPNGAFVDGVVGQYRNPDYFEQPEATDKVVVVGDYPHIVEAYKRLGVAVEVIGKPEPKRKTKAKQVQADAQGEPKTDTKDELQADEPEAK